ncbi:MAG: hypothetical protein U9R08_05155 [Nanoarchaeota archaeon]|nr:hypothetical protein [Nanoarchaeota archaeon]
MSLDEKIELCYLAIGELALGTKVYDPRAMDGLALFLRVNGLDKKIQQLVIDSGIMPLVPSYYGLSNAKNMRFLGVDKTQSPNQRAELVLRSDIEKKEKEYIENFVLHKITSKEQAAGFAKQELEKLLTVLGDVETHYIHGEEDRKNIEALEELKINDYMRIEQNQGDLEDKLKRTKHAHDKAVVGLDETEKEKKLLQCARRYLRLYTGNEFKKRVKTFIEKKAEEFQHLSIGDANKLKHFLRTARNVADVKTKLQDVYGDIKDLNNEIKYNEKSARDCQITLNAIAREKEASGFFRITKRQQIQADEEEILFRLAKKEYNDLLYSIVSNGKFHVHTDNYAEVEFNGFKLRVYHSMNSNSDASCTDSLARMKKENNSESKYGGEISDVVISVHGKGGFRFQPTPKQTEDTVKGEERETPELVMDMKLPTFQSYSALKWARKKNLKNWHTKRYDSKNYASGAVIHTVKENGVQEVEYIDMLDLIEFGEISGEIQLLEQKIVDTKSSRQKKKLQKRVNELINLVKIETEKIEVSGDQHVGCPNVPGRPSNYDFISASQVYQTDAGLPCLIVTSEVLHGTLQKIFSSNKQYFSEVPKKREDLEKKIVEDTSLSDEEKVAELQKFYKVQHESTPITSNSVAKLEVKRRVVPYLEKILENGGTVVLVSGNHYNCSTGEDEAYELASMLDLKYVDNGQVQIFDGLGAKYGSGTMRLPNGKKLYSAHKPQNGTDEVAGAMNQVLKANLDAAIFVFFDRHHCGGGYANGSAFVAAPGMQPWNKYVDAIGKCPGLRGLVNMFYDPGKRYFKWEFVLDPTLEGVMKNEK